MWHRHLQLLPLNVQVTFRQRVSLLLLLLLLYCLYILQDFLALFICKSVFEIGSPRQRLLRHMREARYPMPGRLLWLLDDLIGQNVDY